MPEGTTASPVAVEVLETVKNIVLAISPWVSDQNRYGVEGFTAAELTAAIARDVPGACIERNTVERDSVGTNDRARLALTWNAAGRRAGMPATVFAKGTPSQVSTRILDSAFGLSQSEVRLHNEVHPAVADVTLTPYVARLRTGGRFAIAVNTLGSDEATYWETPRFATDLAWIAAIRASRAGRSDARSCPGSTGSGSRSGPTFPLKSRS